MAEPETTIMKSYPYGSRRGATRRRIRAALRLALGASMGCSFLLIVPILVLSCAEAVWYAGGGYDGTGLDPANHPSFLEAFRFTLRGDDVAIVLLISMGVFFGLLRRALRRGDDDR